MIRKLEPVLVEELIAHVAKRPPASSQGGATAPAKPRIVLALDLYRYTGDPRSETIDFTTIQRIGHRAFVRVGTETIVAVDCVTIGETKSYRMHFDAIATSWLQQVRLLRKRKQLAGAQYELRALLVPAHHLMFFWLAFSSGEGQADLFLPTREAAGAPGRQRLLAGSDVASLIQRAVSRYAEMDARRTQILANLAG